MAIAGLKPPIKDRIIACIASGAITKKLVVLSDGLDSNGEQKVKTADSAGLTVPVGVADHSQDTTKVVDVVSRGRVTCTSAAALATLNTPVSYTATGKVKAAVATEYIIGYNVSTASAADEDVSIELCNMGLKA
jgi:hypothetical protein